MISEAQGFHLLVCTEQSVNFNLFFFVNSQSFKRKRNELLCVCMFFFKREIKESGGRNNITNVQTQDRLSLLREAVSRALGQGDG